MRTPLVLAIAAALGLSSAFLVACGDRNSLLPRSDADALRSDISSAKSNFAAQECRKAEANLRDAQEKAVELPPDVDKDLRANIRTNIETVMSEVTAQCGAPRTTTTAATTATTQATTATTPETTDTSTPDTNTEPPQTETSTPQTTPDDSGGVQAPGQGSQGRARGKNKR